MRYGERKSVDSILRFYNVISKRCDTVTDKVTVTLQFDVVVNVDL